MADDEVEYEFTEDSYPSYVWTKELAIADAMTLAAKIAEATAEFLAVMAARGAAQNNQIADRQLLFSEAAQEIEKLTGEG